MKVVTTVGTSVFENFLRERSNKDDKTFSGHLEALKDSSFEKDWEKAQTRCDKLSDKIADNSKYKVKWNKPSASAEIASIIAIAKEKQNVEVHLIATDTVLSVLAAQLIQFWFEQHKDDYKHIKSVKFELPTNNLLTDQSQSQHIIHKLRIHNQESYQQGFFNLIQVLHSLKLGQRDVLNITGGYKAIIPILTIYGQLQGVSLKYIYDEGETDRKLEIVEIGNLPINFDWSIIYKYYPFYTNQDQIHVTKQNKQILEELYKKHKLFIPSDNKQVYLRTPLGFLINSFAYLKTPESLQVLGLFLEYKFADFYRDSFSDTYTNVWRDKAITNSDIKYDIVLKGKDDVNILVEMKSADQVFYACTPKPDGKGRNTFEQIQNQFEDLKANSSFPNEYWLLFYFIGNRYEDLEQIHANLKTIGGYITTVSEGKTTFHAKYVELKLKLATQKTSRNNPFKAIFGKDIKPEDIVSIYPASNS